MKKTEETQIKCECGCIVNRSDLIKVKKVGKSGKPFKVFCCPDHQTLVAGKAKYRVFACVDCGKKCFANIHAANKIRCDECQRKTHLKQCRNWQAKYQKKTKRKFKAKTEHKNTFHCSEFGTCGQCIKPYFPCRVYTAQLRRKVA